MKEIFFSLSAQTRREEIGNVPSVASNSRQMCIVHTHIIIIHDVHGMTLNVSMARTTTMRENWSVEKPMAYMPAT